MLILDMLHWWYSRGILELIGGLKERLRNAADFFSIGLLMQNFFSPYRQISAQGTSSSALSDRFQAFSDLLISRVVGTVVRLFVLIFGVMVIVLQIAMGLVAIIAWPLIPMAAIGGVVLFFAGVVF